MRFEVPQFIEIEDKIFGPFTWRQFIYLIGGGGIALVLFLTTNLFVFALFGLPLAGLAFMLAFYPINNRPFSVFLESVFSFYSTTSLYLWRRKSQAVYRNEATDLAPATTYTPPAANSSLSSLSRRLELEAIQKETE